MGRFRRVLNDPRHPWKTILARKGMRTSACVARRGERQAVKNVSLRRKLPQLCGSPLRLGASLRAPKQRPMFVPGHTPVRQTGVTFAGPSFDVFV